jgi:hypothetical protein
VGDEGEEEEVTVDREDAEEEEGAKEKGSRGNAISIILQLS